MGFNEALAGRIRDALAQKLGVEEKRMFGGVGFLLHGNLLVCVWRDSLIARIGLAAYEAALALPNVRKFDITGRAMKGWVMIDPEGLASDGQLQDWIERAWDFVSTLPGR